jgi:phosphoglycerol transferase
MTTNSQPLSQHSQRPLGAVARQEWRWWLPGALLCVLVASLLTSGWPQGLLPRLDIPYWYTGDGLSHAWMIKRVTEGWVLENAHSGFPFGSAFHDYPGSDVGNLLALKLIGLANGHWQAIYNIYYLAGFGLCFASACVVMRAAGLARPYALTGALLFTFLPFHAERISHLFYTWYFVVPLYFHCALRIADGEFIGRHFSKPLRALLAGAGLVAMASFGVYYALFGVLLFAIAAFAGLCRGDWLPAKGAAVAACCVTLGVLLNVAPSLLYKQTHGVNAELQERNVANGEVFGFKPLQLLLPRDGHRNRQLRELHDMYAAKMPLVNENSTATLGAVGALGFLAMLGVAFAGMAGRPASPRLKLLALITVVLLLFGAIGGLGSLFTLTISTWIRGWNRISVFIGFSALLGLMLMLQDWLAKRQGGHKRTAAALCGVLAVFGIWDQGGKVNRPYRAMLEKDVQQDQAFVAAIEAALPPGAAVYQLPYMRFPEAPTLFQMTSYDHMRGYLHSKQLHWSYAAMRGRDGDQVFRRLATEPMERQLQVLSKLGFSGVYVNRGGYADAGAAVVASLTALTGAPPALSRADGQIVFFRLPPPATQPSQLAGKSALQLIQHAYGGTAGILNTPAALAEGVRFSAEAFPLLVTDVQGLSTAEAWGRWSDANLAPTVRVDFREPLSGRFTLLLTMHAFGPNAGQPLAVRVGSRQYSVPLQGDKQTYRIPVDLGSEQATRVELAPPQPVSPRALGVGADDRKLGIGLFQLAIER